MIGAAATGKELMSKYLVCNNNKLCKFLSNFDTVKFLQFLKVNFTCVKILLVILHNKFIIY